MSVWWGEQDGCIRRQEPRGDHQPFSQDFEDIALFETEAGLVLIKKALKGFDVHRVVLIHYIWCRLLDFWHCNGLPDW